MKALELVSESEGLKLLGIISKSRAEWYTAHLANMYQSVTTVGVLDEMPNDQLMFVINQSEISSIVISASQLQKFCEVKKEDGGGLMAKLTNLIIIESEITPEDKALVEENGFTIHHWEKVVDKGREVALEPQETKFPETDDCFMICYTSGATGDPKGVMITHKMIV